MKPSLRICLMLACSSLLACASSQGPATPRLQAGWEWPKPAPEESVEPRGPERAQLLRQYQTVLDGTISAARGGGYKVPFPELLQLVGRIDRLDSSVLRVARDLLRDQILASPSSTVQESRIFIAICSQLRDADSVISTLQMLPIDGDTRSVRTIIISIALGDLHERRLYSELIRNSDILLGRIEAESGLLDDRSTLATIETAAILYEARLAVEDLSRAHEIATWVTSFKRDHGTYVFLMGAALRVGSESESKRLNDEAHQLLSADEQAKLDQAISESR